MDGFIKIRNLVKKYKLNNGQELLAVNDVSLDIEQGDIYGIMGLSGAGKSTLIRLLNRLEEPTSGEVLVRHEIIDRKKKKSLGYEDKNILKFNTRLLREYRKKTGMIFQHFNLLNSKNVADNIAFPLQISGWKKRDIKKRVDELLEIVGLSDKKLNYPEQLSGGQKQRVAIARALANNPQLLLSDEATSALDPRTTNSILELLKNINKKFGITIILITHQIEVIKKICNKAAIMSDGQIIEKGETKEIFLNPKTELAKEFVQNISHEEFRTEEEIKSREENNGKLRLSLKYNEEQVNESYITKIIRKYDVEVNILSGFIDKVGDIIVGNLLIEISASEEKAKDIIEWLKENKIDSEVV
ncbi:methionine ABC transporter ATP-binding protein [Leptotrichia hongkongensis]|uniref:Methionine ABC transporter ATP-binding protein n=1 Tax=Leptotrichia hongkongensis TaxID=554406 RepID=A0ABV4S4H5_9FUSO